MNGAQPKIEIFKPFGEAFELMKKILFQPFDLGKWCVIGFAAFLANLGGGLNFRYNYNQRSDLRKWQGFQNLIDEINQIPHWIVVLGVAILVTLILAIVVVFAWLRARGRFMFIDCIVKNRGAIAEPWREFRKQGNSYFLFSLLFGCAFLVIVTLLALPFLLPIVRGVTFLHLHDVYLISMIVLWAVVLLLLVFAWALVAHFMVAVMYRQRCRAHEAFRIDLSLIASYPGEITLYCLFWIVLVLGAAFVACASICVTCCIALIPYVGTVILLPLYVWLRAFSLMFLQQFGPDYDVWAGIQQPEPVPPSPSLGPPPLPA
jgi:hypothetical protein